MELQGSKTWENLQTAFAGESQAHTKYQYYASKAKNDGYVQIANIFLETSKNEKEHAKIWFKYLHDGAVPDTIANLNDAADGENYEWTAHLDLQQLRSHRHRQQGSRDLPGVHASEVLLRASCRELLGFSSNRLMEAPFGAPLLMC